MPVEYVTNEYYTMFHNASYHRYRETHLSILLDLKFWQSQRSVNVGQGYQVKCMLVEYVTNDYYARFNNPSYHRYRETHFSILLD